MPVTQDLSTDVASAVIWLNRTLFATTLSVLNAVRDRTQSFRFCSSSHVCPCLHTVGRLTLVHKDKVEATHSPTALSESATLVLLNAEDTLDRICLVEVRRPTDRLFEEFIKEEVNYVVL